MKVSWPARLFGSDDESSDLSCAPETGIDASYLTVRVTMTLTQSDEISVMHIIIIMVVVRIIGVNTYLLLPVSDLLRRQIKNAPHCFFDSRTL